MNAMKRFFSLVIAACILCSLSTLSSAETKDDKAAPVNGRDYAFERKKAYQAPLDNFMTCSMEKIPKSGDQWGKWKPEELYLCKPELETFRKARINIDKGPQLIWGNDQEKKSILEDAALIDSFHVRLCNIFSSFIYDENNFTLLSLSAYRSIGKWYNEYGKKYREQLIEIHKLIDQYASLKKQGRMVSSPFEHFECSESTLHKMNEVRSKLGAYFAYNVDTAKLWPMAFLAELDGHSMGFQKNVDRCRRSLDAGLKRIKTVYQALMSSGFEQLEQIDKKSIFYSFHALPKGVRGYMERLEDTYNRIQEGMKEISSASNPIGKFLTQADMSAYPRFHKNSACSYVQSLQNALNGLLLNTKDKNGNPLKHNIRGQL